MSEPVAVTVTAPTPVVGTVVEPPPLVIGPANAPPFVEFAERGAPGGVATLDGEEHLTLSQVPPSVASSSQEGGLAKLKAGLRSVVNITDPKYGAVADSGVTNNRVAIEKAIKDAEKLRIPVYAPGTEGHSYGIEGRLTIPDGVDLVGDGGDILKPATEFLCMSATTNIAFGWTGVGEGPSHGNNPKPEGSLGNRGGISGNFIVNGNHVATQPLLIGSRTQSCFDPIAVINGAAQPAYEAGKTYEPGERVLYKGFTFVNLVKSTGTAPSVTAWVASKGAGAYPTTTATWQVVADSAGLVCQWGQNNHFRQVNVQNCAGLGIIWDGGWGGGKWDVVEVNECGSAGTWQTMSIQTYTTAPGVYAVPTKFTINQAIIERASEGALGSFLHVAGSQITFRDPVFQSSHAGAEWFTAVAMVYDGTNVSYRLKLRDAEIGLPNEKTNAFAVSTGCWLDHQGTVIGSGEAPQYAYLLQEGFRVEEERPTWPGAGMTLLNPSGTVTTLANFEIGAAARHYAPVQTFTVGSPETPQATIAPAGGVKAANVLVNSGANAGGGSGCVGFSNSTSVPGSEPAGVVIYAHGGVLRYRTKAGTIGTAAGDWQKKEASYEAVEGDVGVIMTCPASTAVVVTLPEAAVFGRGVFTVRRTDNSSGTLEIKRKGADTLGKAGEALGTANVSVPAFQVQRFLSDGTSKWYGL